MKDHEKYGEGLRDAIARGDLDEARRQAAVLTRLRLEGSFHPAWQANLDAMHAALAQVSGSQSLEEASRALALLAKTCGDCHAMLGRAGHTSGVAMWQAPGSRSVMMRHQHAAARLWDGLVVPSEEAWKAGAGELSESPLAPEVLSPGKTPVPKVGVLVQSVHELGRRAEAATPIDARVEIYGQTMATCAACHQWLGGGPSSGAARD